jgi:hypothetical protein
VDSTTTEPSGVAFVERAEGAHVAFGDGEKQRLVARAAVHVLTVASPARKSFTPRREFPRAFRSSVTVPNPAKAADGGRRTADGPSVLIYRYLTWREGREAHAEALPCAQTLTESWGLCP